ncbi:hypothetical protein [Glutamicibacter sp. M10]|uniref:hypothetical protein n=1 Tax=Glutamicibacter sp. M10 TaxID=3023076 RepID=UPI0021C8FBFB|nr:hypothetical protein [Glutamicibacter sp. M10]UXN31015.1 hypothetical protein N6V40_11340 [Glutamicibacter sp. M10]
MANFITHPSSQYVQNEGSALQTIGVIVAVIGLLIGGIVIINDGSPVFIGLLPIGLLVAITGYLKQIAAATTASYILALDKHEAEGKTSTQ